MLANNEIIKNSGDVRKAEDVGNGGDGNVEDA